LNSHSPDDIDRYAGLTVTGRCCNCDTGLEGAARKAGTEEALFCDAACAWDWQRRERAERQRLKRAPQWRRQALLQALEAWRRREQGGARQRLNHLRRPTAIKSWRRRERAEWQRAQLALQEVRGRLPQISQDLKQITGPLEPGFKPLTGTLFLVKSPSPQGPDAAFKATGRCCNCGARLKDEDSGTALTQGALFCDAYCAADWQQRDLAVRQAKLALHGRAQALKEGSETLPIFDLDSASPEGHDTAWAASARCCSCDEPLVRLSHVRREGRLFCNACCALNWQQRERDARQQLKLSRQLLRAERQLAQQRLREERQQAKLEQQRERAERWQRARLAQQERDRAAPQWLTATSRMPEQMTPAVPALEQLDERSEQAPVPERAVAVTSTIVPGKYRLRNLMHQLERVRHAWEHIEEAPRNDQALPREFKAALRTLIQRSVRQERELLAVAPLYRQWLKHRVPFPSQFQELEALERLLAAPGALLGRLPWGRPLTAAESAALPPSFSGALAVLIERAGPLGLQLARHLTNNRSTIWLAGRQTPVVATPDLLELETSLGAALGTLTSRVRPRLIPRDAAGPLQGATIAADGQESQGTAGCAT
jgi:hypothetical protein